MERRKCVAGMFELSACRAMCQGINHPLVEREGTSRTLSYSLQHRRSQTLTATLCRQLALSSRSH